MSLRRPLLIALLIGAVGVLVGGLAGHVMMGVLGCVGMLIGVVNTRLLQRSVVKVISSEEPSKKALSVSSGRRLLLVTLLALALGFFVRPDGLGVFFGLAIFQFIMIVHTVLPVMKGLRQQ
ncbi:MAG: ATP synthase subunit I [Sciscionella sp.]